MKLQGLQSWAALIQSNMALKVCTSMAMALMLGVLYYMLARPAADIASSTTLAAVAWPAPTVAIALLWLQPKYLWAPYLLAVWVAMVIVGAQDDLPLLIDSGFAFLNVLEVAACAWLGQRYVAHDGHIDSVQHLLRFVLLLPLLVVACVAVGGAILATSLLPSDWWLEWRTFMVGNGLAILVLVPMWLYWIKLSSIHIPMLKTAAWRTNMVSALGIITAVLVVIGVQLWDASGEVLRALLSLVLAATALYGGMRSASLCMGTAAVLAVLLKVQGMGPYRHAGLDETWRLQLDLAGMAVLTFLIAVAVRELQVMAVRMEQKRRLASLGLMASGVAHDFNNVLGAAGGYAEMALEGLDTQAPARRPLEEVVSAVARGRDLTEQILLAARKGDRQRQVMDMRDCVQQAVRLARPICPEGVSIVYTQPIQPMAVQGHAAQLIRLALNLIRNASQAARTQVVVTLSAGLVKREHCLVGDCPHSHAVWLDVVDDGAGIAASDLPHLFEPFFSTHASGKGTGLGLAIVAAVATEHEGGVAVSSSVKGTAFRVYLPSDLAWEKKLTSAPPTPASVTAVSIYRAGLESQSQLVTPDVCDAADKVDADLVRESYDELPVLGQGELVWVVDDDPQLCTLYEDWLAAMGFEPVTFHDPALALSQFQKAPQEIDMLVVDWEMPQMCGDTLIARMHALSPHLPVLLCSGQPAVAALALQLGVNSLLKPVDRATFTQAMASLWSQKQKQERKI